MDYLSGHILYLLTLIACALAVPVPLWQPESEQFLLVLGSLAIWRYGWALLNWLRFLIYRFITFPRWAKQRDALGEAALPSHNYFLITSFRIDSETSRRVYHSVIDEAIACGIPTTLVVSLVERADQTLVKQIFQHKAPPSQVSLAFVRIPGTGKRDALAAGFRAISRRCPPEDAVVSVIDGDSMLAPGITRKCAPFFALMPKLGALTTEEYCEVEGAPIFREWYNMRFAQRNVFMGSHSLSKRVLTLTGRMSMFRACLVTAPEFIDRIERDYIDHWRLGRFKFLTGDDKSSWYHLLAQGYEMIYVPDAIVTTIETPPHPSFLQSSIVLMRRWFGNMLRTNGRAIRLGPKPMGWFPWLAILDQRISMWTTLTGPFAAVMASLVFDPFILCYYLLWIMLTRYLLVLMLAASRPNISPFWPFLLYYNQVVGSFVKSIILFRLDKQRWTRQNTKLSGKTGNWVQSTSGAVHLLSLGLFLTLIATLSGILDVPSPAFWYEALTEYFHG